MIDQIPDTVLIWNEVLVSYLQGVFDGVFDDTFEIFVGHVLENGYY